MDWNLSIPALYEEAVRRREALILVHGPLVCRTGQHTGRSPNDKFIVREPSSEDKVWWSKVNRPIDGAQFEAVHQRMLNYCEGKELFVQDRYAGADRATACPCGSSPSRRGTAFLPGTCSSTSPAPAAAPCTSRNSP